MQIGSSETEDFGHGDVAGIIVLIPVIRDQCAPAILLLIIAEAAEVEFRSPPDWHRQLVSLHSIPCGRLKLPDPFHLEHLGRCSVLRLQPDAVVVSEDDPRDPSVPGQRRDEMDELIVVARDIARVGEHVTSHDLAMIPTPPDH